MAQALVIYGVKNHPSCPVRSIAGSLYRFFSIFTGTTTKVALCDFSFCIAAERNTHMLKFINHTGSVLYHHLNRILVSEVIASLESIEHMRFPVVFLFIADGGCNPALGCT